VGILTKSSKNLRTYSMELNVTSMIDMFTILLVFLLKSYSVEYSNVLVSKDLRLPISTETRLPENILNLIVTTNEVIVDGNNILQLENGNINPKDLSEDESVISPLYRALNNRKMLQDESIQDFFKGKIILQADRLLEYDVLHKIIYTAGEAGYPKFKLLVLTNDN
jgi:biopolymer transport protein ExbD